MVGLDHRVLKINRANIDTSGFTPPNEATGSYPTCVIAVAVRLFRHRRQAAYSLRAKISQVVLK